MKITNLIAKLEELKEKHGDLPVFMVSDLLFMVSDLYHIKGPALYVDQVNYVYHEKKVLDYKENEFIEAICLHSAEQLDHN